MRHINRAGNYSRVYCVIVAQNRQNVTSQRWESPPRRHQPYPNTYDSHRVSITCMNNDEIEGIVVYLRCGYSNVLDLVLLML